MKITDEVKTFRDEDSGETLEVSSNVSGTHEMPSAYLYAEDGHGNAQGFGTFDIDQIKEIIQHMAKMAGLEVSLSKRFEPKYQPGDRIRSLTSDNYGELGTVLSDTDHDLGWNVRVRYDRDLDGCGLLGLFKYSELERLGVTGE